MSSSTDRPGPTLESSLDGMFLASLIDALPVGVIVLDDGGRVVRYNAYEQSLAARSEASVIGQLFFQDIAPCIATSDLLPAFQRYVETGEELNVDLAFQFPFAHLLVPRDVRLRLRGFLSGGRRFAFLLVEDISEEVQAGRLRELLAMLIAHDMKNPLTAVRLNMDMVLREIDQKGRAHQRLDEARLAAERLDRMIRLFLDVYRLENTGLPISRAPVDVMQVAQEVIRQQQPLAQSYGLTLELRGSISVLADSDAGLLLRTIENLVDNAMRHAREAIRIVLRDTTAFIEIDVIDDGQGVPEEAKRRIFDKFASMSADLRGYNQGLGLTFCSLAIQRLGGSIEVVDAVPHGAIFRIRLARG